MNALTQSQLWVNLAGVSESRRAVGRLVGVELLALSLAFLVQLDVVLPYPLPTLLFLGFIVAPGVYAGGKSAGVATGVIGVWLPMVWASVVPPLIGYFIGSNGSRFNHPRFVGVEYTSQLAELTNGLEYAATVWLLFAAFIGILSYLVGALGHEARTSL